ncbi:MAG: phosphoribosylformylglycinamidine synthase [Chloroflexi bacterium]|nr:phosphoribosylformylglycinamidine synthase [Chloroflexota bacterium]
MEATRNEEPYVPRVHVGGKPTADLVHILEADDSELQVIGKKGILNVDGSRRGPLAMDLRYMKAMQAHFRCLGREPMDIELESIAQTWSEHCHHTIFADPIDDIEEGIFRKFIRGATERIIKERGDDGFCVSLFTDNSGAIAFDDVYLITDKVETHNSPSALDAYGGAITGNTGVFRDAIGFGLGANPIIGAYGFCLGKPNDATIFYRDKNLTQKTNSPRRTFDGMVSGIRDGGNQAGVNTPQGFIYFDDRYGGKPLLFARIVGLIPRESAGRPSHKKAARVGDYVVMVGGRVGKDGIHGATFSSEAIDEGSPATAVQIGDPITQKKLSDAIIYEARDRGLYNSITDNGAGGLSCSVAEMAKECGGCHVKLDDVPVKYPGLAPWEIWISESQERMTLAVPPEKWDEFSDLMQRRGVEATVIGEFTDSGRCTVDYNDERVMDLEMDFLHDGLPPRRMQTTFTRKTYDEPEISPLEDLTSSFHSMLGRLNIASWEFISQQFDHEVQGGSVVKPLQGRGRVNGDATVTRPLLDSNKGVVISQGINPSYSDIDTYDMAACAIDTAVRNAVAVGADLEHLALLDNFCWCSSDDPERLGQLKRAAQACYDVAVGYSTPFISGKDSMFNDFKGFDEQGNPIKISVPPTLLASSIAIVEDVRNSVTLDAKFAGDLVYILGETHQELGGSEYFAMIGEDQNGEKFIGNTVPQVDTKRNRKLYVALSGAIRQCLVASAQSVHKGGLAVALAKTAMGGRLGMDVSLEELPGEELPVDELRDDFSLYSESQGRLIVTVNPENREEFETAMQGNAYEQIGKVRNDTKFEIIGRNGGNVIESDVDTMLTSYRSTFEGY